MHIKNNQNKNSNDIERKKEVNNKKIKKKK